MVQSLKVKNQEEKTLQLNQPQVEVLEETFLVLKQEVEKEK
jgi:hypothetical protein